MKQDTAPGLHNKNNLIPQKRRQRVLLVDDDMNDLLYYTAILQHEGYEVRSLVSYEEAGDCFDREGFDLVIVSQGSAAFEGRVVLRRVLARNRAIPVFVLSRSSDIGCYLEAMQMGAFDYCEKPLVPSDLAEMVARHLQSARSQAA